MKKKVQPIYKTSEQIAKEVLEGNNPIGDFMRAMDKMIIASKEFNTSLKMISDGLKQYKK